MYRDLGFLRLWGSQADGPAAAEGTLGAPYAYLIYPHRPIVAYLAQTHRLGAKLHPLTVEQNALTSFKSRTTAVPAYANTIGPALFLAADRIIGGADGAFNRGMQWQGLSLRMTLQHEPTPWIPSTYMPTLPGRLFYVKELGQPLVAEPAQRERRLSERLGRQLAGRLRSAGGEEPVDAACVPLVFKVGSRVATVRFGVGRRCG